MDVLDRLKLDVVNCRNFPTNRPYAKADEVGARVLLFNPDADTIVTPALIDEAINPALDYTVGLRFNCTMGEGAVSFANARSATVERYGGKAKISIVMFDVELEKTHDAADRLAWQAAFLDRWDAIRYGRPTIYNVAGLQNETQNDYVRMLRRNRQTGQQLRKIGVQPYFGETMEPANVRDVVDALVDVVIRTGAGSRLDVEPTIDPAHPLHYIAALDCETIGATIFEAGRIP